MLRSELNLDVTNFLDYYDDNDNLVEGRKTLLGLDENGMPIIEIKTRDQLVMIFINLKERQKI